MRAIKNFVWHLIYINEQEMDLGILFSLLFTATAITAIMVELFGSHSLSLQAWSALTTLNLANLIVSVPINRARILAKSKMLGEVAEGLSKIVPTTTSTDVQELVAKENGS